MVSKVISKKCRYALRAVFELAWRGSKDPVKIQNIAVSQAIPPRFLEVIMAELKQGGFVKSIRGNKGGYALARPADQLTVGEVLAFLAGDLREPDELEKQNFVPVGNYAFSKLLESANNAVSSVYDDTTFADLIKEELLLRKNYVPNYAI